MNWPGVRVAILALAITVSACQAPQRPAPAGAIPEAAIARSAIARSAPAPKPGLSHVVLPDGSLARFDPGRFRIMEEAGGDSGFTGRVVGPGGLKLEDTAVLFTDAEDRFVVVRSLADPKVAALVAPQTDVEGAFRSPAIFPAGFVAVANALLSRNRRLVGIGRAGGEAIGVSVGSTFAVEFLRDQAGSASALQSVLASPSLAASVAEQGRQADGFLASGLLAAPIDGPDGDLAMGNGVRLASRYAASVLAARPEALGAWRAILGRPLGVVATIAGNFRRRVHSGGAASPSVATGLAEPAGLTQGPPGDDGVYLAELGAYRVKRIAGGFADLVAGAIAGDPLSETATLSADGTPLAAARLDEVLAVRADADGNLAITFNDLVAEFNTVGFVCRKSGTYFGRALAAGTFYRLGAPDGLWGYRDGPLASARFRSPAGLAFDSDGNLFVADRRNNRIRRIDRQTGAVSTVLGDGWPWLDAIQTATGNLPVSALSLEQAGGQGTGSVTVPDFGRLVDQPGGTGPGGGLRASFNRPLALDWRRVDDRQELYVYDSYNNAVRRASCPYPGSFADAAVATIAGSTRVHAHTGLGYSVTIGDPGPAADGPGPAARLDLARYDPGNRALAQVVRGGLAVDPDLGRLFILDTNNSAIRMLDLATGQLRTVAAHDPDRPEGDAARVLLSTGLSGIAVLRDHSVVFSDAMNHVVRRLVLGAGD